MLLPKFMPISFFRRGPLVFEVFQEKDIKEMLATSSRRNLVCPASEMITKTIQ